MTCALCNRPAPTFTMCDHHRHELGVHVRRAAIRPKPYSRNPRTTPHPKRKTLNIPENTTPRDQQDNPRYAPITTEQIQAVRDAYKLHSYRTLGEQIGLSHNSVKHIVHAHPGDHIQKTTSTKITTWMETNT